MENVEKKPALEQLVDKFGALIDTSKEEITKSKVAKALVEEDPSAGSILSVII